MPDRWIVALAASAAIGALRPSPTPLLVGAVLSVGALLLRRPAWLCLAIALCTSSLAQRALDGLDGLPAATVRAPVVLLTDPEASFNGVRSEARYAGRHVELRAAGPAADALRDRLAGEHLVVRATTRPGAGGDWEEVRHLAGVLTVHRVESWGPPELPWRVANGLRRTITAGATSLSADQQALFSGLVLGDDRAQSAALADDFRGAGLTHLLAVSGQNVAFVLALLGPLGRRLHLAPRLLLTLAAIGLFGVMTRFEPSVLRASAMAAVAATAGTAGLPAQRLRILSVALTGLLVIDPLLVRSVGFQLSVGATIAIALMARPIAAALPGPAWLRDAMAVTVAAQLGVAPVLLARFGPIPLASLPANVLAVPAAGLVMGWGLTGGLLAGLAPAGAAAWLHLPSRLLLGWIGGVAQRSARLPIGEVGWVSVVVLAAAVGLMVAGSRRPTARTLGGLGRWAAVCTFAVVVMARQAPPPLRDELTAGVVRWHHGSTDVVVLGGGGWRNQPNRAEVLASLRRAGVGGIDLLVADGSDADLVAAVTTRHPTGVVVARDPIDDLDVTPPPRTPVSAHIGDLLVTLAPGEDRTVVEARPSGVDPHGG
ncbi:MAG: ComEC/Rec2 family competence protein [Actinomycetota bacterium]|nr:ComEC/Rec2 family competence protein [Actinomycetota bacterium]